MTTYTYKYLDRYDRPLLKCPFCQHSLTGERGILLTLSCGGHVFQVETSLYKDGTLIDTEYGAVLNGHHSVTECGRCGKQLVYYEECTEECTEE